MDLRGETRVEASETDELVFVVEHGAKRVDVKAGSQRERERWISALKEIIDAEAKKRKQARGRVPPGVERRDSRAN